MSKKSSLRKENKSRTSRGYFNREIDSREPLERFLIVCEGEKTEPNYFHSFRVRTANIIEIDIHGLGENTISLVETTIDLKDEDGDYDQVWCVFDRDSFPAERFNAALEVAKNNNIDVAYSNEAFELWFLLHFEYRDTAMERGAYKKKLNDLLGHKYEKNSQTIYAELENKQSAAIKRAKKLLEQWNPPNPERDNPSTTVHLLVEQLNRFIH